MFLANYSSYHLLYFIWHLTKVKPNVEYEVMSWLEWNALHYIWKILENTWREEIYNRIKLLNVSAQAPKYGHKLRKNW